MLYESLYDQEGVKKERAQRWPNLIIGKEEAVRGTRALPWWYQICLHNPHRDKSKYEQEHANECW